MSHDGSQTKRVYRGCLDDLPEQESTLVRVFFSSTFTDMSEDRNYLMKNSVRRIRQACLKKNLDFQIVDFRWGVRDEASIDHSTNDIVLEEVRVCKQMSRGPYFVVFLGDKYGSRPIPREIEANEYKTLFRTAMKIGCDTFLMNQWYKRDHNAEPAVYYLQPITDVLKNYDNEDPDKAALREKDRKEWDNVNKKLTEYLRRAADQAFEENHISKDQRLKYFYSVTEAETLEGIVNSDDFRNRVLAYFRTFEEINPEDSIAKRYIDLIENTSDVDQEAKDLRERLKIAKVQPVLLPEEMKKDTLFWTPKGVDPENEEHMQYLMDLDKHFEEKMIKMIMASFQDKQVSMSDEMLYEEVLHHLHFAKSKLESFCGREDILEDIREQLSEIHVTDLISDMKDFDNDPVSPLNGIVQSEEIQKQIKDGSESSVSDDNGYFEEVRGRMQTYKERGIIYANGDMDRDLDSDPDKNMKMEMIKKCVLKEYGYPVILYGDSGSGKTSIMAKVAEQCQEWFPGADVILRFLGTSVGSSSIRDVITSIIRQIMKINNKTLPSFVDFGGDFLYLTQLFEAILMKYDPSKKLVIILDSADQLSTHERAHLMNWAPLKVPKNVKLIISMLPNLHSCLHNIKNRLVSENQYIEVPTMSTHNSDLLITRQCSRHHRRLTKPQRRHLLEMFTKCSRPLYMKLLVDQAIEWRSTTDYSYFKVGPSIPDAVNMLFNSLEQKRGSVFVCKFFGFLSAAKEGLSFTELEDLLSLDDETLQDTYLYHLPPDPQNIRVPPSVISLLIKDIKDYMVLLKSGGKKVLQWYHRQFAEVARKRYLSKNKCQGLYRTLVDYFRGTWHEKVKPLELFKKKKGSYPDAKRGVPDQPLYLDIEKANKRKLIEYPHCLINSGMFQDFRDENACCYEWLYAKCKNVSVSSVIDDMKMALAAMDEAGEIDDMETYSDIKTIKQLLSLGYDSVRKDSSHLSLQILGQLGMTYNGSEAIKKLVAQTKEWSESCGHSLLLPLTQCLPPPDGIIQILINAQVWFAGEPSEVDEFYEETEYDRDFSHVMALREKNNILVVLEPQKDLKDDYLSVFDLNDNGSPAHSEKLDRTGVTTISLTPNEKLSVLGGKHPKLIRSESFSVVDLPVEPTCIVVSELYVVYSSIKNVCVCTFNPSENSVTIVRSVQMERDVKHLVVSPDNQYLVIMDDSSTTVLRLETLDVCCTDFVEEVMKMFGSDNIYHSVVCVTKSNIVLHLGYKYKGRKTTLAFDIEAGKTLYSFQHSEHYDPDYITLHPSEKYFAVGFGTTSIINGDCKKNWFIHNTDDGKAVTECSPEFASDCGVSSLKLFGTDEIWAATTPEFSKMNDITIFYCGTLESPTRSAIPCQSLQGHSLKVLQLIVSSDGSLLYSASQDCTIRVWDLARVGSDFRDKYLQTGQEVDIDGATKDFKECQTNYSTTTVNIARDNQTVLVGRSDGHLIVKDLNTSSTVYEKTLVNSIKIVFMSKSGKEIILISQNDNVLILDSQSYEVKHTLQTKFSITCAAESNGILVVGKAGMEAKGKVFNIESGKLIKDFQMLYSLSQVAVNSTGTKLVATFFDFPLVMTIDGNDEMDGESFTAMNEFNDTMMNGSSAIDISPDDQYAFSASTDGGIRVVKMTGRYLMRFDQKSSAVAATFSPDSKYIVSCGFKTIYVWSITEGKLSCKLKKHDDFVICAKFDRSGKYLMTSSRDKKLVLWDFPRGISLATFVSHVQLPLVDISLDAKHIVFVPTDIDDVCILKLNKLLSSIVDGTHKLKISKALLGATAMALSFSSQKMQKKETSKIGCEIM